MSLIIVCEPLTHPIMIEMARESVPVAANKFQWLTLICIAIFPLNFKFMTV